MESGREAEHCTCRSSEQSSQSVFRCRAYPLAPMIDANVWHSNATSLTPRPPAQTLHHAQNLYSALISSLVVLSSQYKPFTTKRASDDIAIKSRGYSGDLADLEEAHGLRLKSSAFTL